MQLTLRKASAWGLMSLAVLATFATAHGGVLETHSQVTAWSWNGSQPNVWLESEGPADTGVVFDSNNGPWEVWGGAQASTSLTADGFLHAGAIAYSDVPGASDGSVGSAEASAGWRDVVFLPGPELPDYVRLTLEIEAWMSGEGMAFSSGVNLEKSGKYVAGLPWRGMSSVDDVYLRGPGYEDQSGLQVSGFDSWSMTDGLFQGVFHVDALYDDTLGGYYWEVRLTVSAGAVRTLNESEGDFTLAATDVLNSVGLTAVTDPEGNALAVTFDSGLGMAAVPEPQGWMLLGCGIVVLCGVSRRRALSAWKPTLG